MLFGLFITLGVAVLSVALRSYQSSISQKVGAFGILTASFLAIYFITGSWILGLLSALSWLFLPWLEILTRIRALRLPREKALRPKSPPSPEVFPTLDEITTQIESEGFSHISDDPFRFRIKGLPAKAPDDPVTVIAVECDSEPAQDNISVRKDRPRHNV